MSSLFSRRADSVLAAVAGGLVAIFVGVPTLLMLFQRGRFVTGEGRPVAQPIAFDHRHHAGDDGIDCGYCHDLADRSPTAGMPTTKLCLGCHVQVWTDSPELAPLWTSLTQGRPIAWTRVHDLPDFVFFDHSAHVGNGVGCVTCHGRVDRMARVVQVASLSMDWCVECHRDPAPHLRPRAQVASFDWRAPPGSQPALGRALTKRYGVRPSTDCSTCHR